MALSVVIDSVCQTGGCKSLAIYDGTGVDLYDTGIGWGLDNINVSEMITTGTCTLTISSDNLTNDVSIDVSDRLFTTLTGDVSIVIATTSLTGVGTLFLTELTAGDIVFTNGYAFQINTIISDVSATVTVPARGTINSKAIALYNEYISVVNTDLGLASTSSISDGTYIFTLEGTTAKDSGSGTLTTLLYCQAKCCVYKKLQQVYKYYNCNNCDDDYIDDTLLAYSMLKSLEASGYCAYVEELETILALINRLCNIEDCNC